MASIAELGVVAKATGVKETGQELDKLSTAADKADKSSAKLNKTSDKTAETQKKTAKAVKDSSGALGQVANSSVVAEKSMGALGFAAGRLVAQLAAISAAVLGINQVISTLAGFERSMGQVQAITGATTEEMRQLRDTAKELGATTEFSSAQAADALKFLGMAGFDAAKSISAMPAVLDLATLSGMGIAEAADVTSNIMSGFGLAATEAAHAADILAVASNSSNTSVAQLGDAMKFAAPVANSLKISMGDTAAAIGVMSDAGLQGSQAGTGLRAVLASLVKPSKEGQIALKAMGLTIKDVNPQAKSLTDIFTLMRSRGLDAEAAMRLFGREAASSGLVLAEYSDKLGDLSQKYTDVTDASSKMAGIIRDDLRGDLDNLSSAAESVIIGLGEAGVTGALRSSVQATTEFILVLSDWTKYLGDALFVVGTLGAAMAGPFLASIVSSGAALVTTAASAVSAAGAMGTLRIAVTGLSAAFSLMGGPIGAVIMALGAALYVVRQRASEAADTAARYANIIEQAGTNSEYASLGIEKATEAFTRLNHNLTKAESIIAAEKAMKAMEHAMLNIQQEAFLMSRSWSSATSEMGDAIEKARVKFDEGQISVEDFNRELDILAANNPDYADKIAALQAFARTVAAARGEVNALNAAIAGGGVVESRDERARPSDAIVAPIVGDRPINSGGGGALDFGAGGGAGKKGGGGGKDRTGRDMESRLDALKQSLASENEARLQAYVKDMETLNWYLDNKKMTEDEYNQWKKRVEEEAFEGKLSEQEQLIADHQRELEALQMFFDQKKLTEEEFLRWQKEINERHEEEMFNLRGMQYAAALDATGDLMGAMAQAIGNGNESMLKAQRIFGAASALVSTYIGAAKALELGFPQNFAAMAAVLAKGMSLVGAIKSGSKSSGGGGGASVPTQQSAAPPAQKPINTQAVEIKLHGDNFSRASVEQLMEQMNELSSDGFKLIIGTT